MLGGSGGVEQVHRDALGRRPSPTNGGRPAQHLVQDAAERVEVRAAIDRARRARLLGRHVDRRADQRAGLRRGTRAWDRPAWRSRSRAP